MKKTMHIAVTGAAGNIGYALLFRIASGAIFGPDQPVHLHLIEIEAGMPNLEGVVMELEDCAFPLLAGITATSDLNEGFAGVNWALLVGSVPRKQGMERADLLGINGKIFVGQGQAIQASAADDVRVLVVGNPCNTNAWIAKESAPEIPAERWFAMTRLDENRAKSQLATKANVAVGDISNLCVWGNHSPTMFADFTNAKIAGKPVTDVITESAWLENEFLPLVGQRGAAVIEARGASSAASAANAALDTVMSLSNPTPEGDWTSVAVSSKGEYGTPEGLMTSMPIRVGADGNWSVVEGVQLSEFAQQKINLSIDELKAERDMVKGLLG